jgi:hypothetical protein
VDLSDLAKWRDGYHKAAPGIGSVQYGDANSDQFVDGADFLSWQQQVGVDAPVAELDAAMDAALATLGVNVAAVPEPGSVVAMAACAAFMAVNHRRRNRLRV